MIEDSTPGDAAMSSTAKGVLVVAGVSGALIIGLVALLLLRCVSAVIQLVVPKSVAKPKPKKKEAHVESSTATAAVDAVNRGPDLKSLIKDQQKASKASKGTSKDDQASHHELFLNTLKGHGDVVCSVAWSADGTQLLTTCEDMMVRMWELLDVTNRNPKFRHLRAAKPPTGAAWGDAPGSVTVLMKGTPDYLLAGYAATADKDGHINYDQEWLVTNPHGREPATMLVGAVRGAALGALGGVSARGVVASCSRSKDVRLYNMQGRELAVVEPSLLTNHCLAMSPDGRFMSVSGFAAEAKLWEIKWAKDTGDFKGCVKAMELKGHKSQVLSVAFSPNGKRAVTASKDGTLRVWNLDVRYTMQEDPKTLLVIPQPLPQGVFYQHLAYGPGGMIAASWEGHVHMIRASDGELLHKIDAHDAPITCMQWCPRLVKTPGTTVPHGVLATSSRDKRVRMWRGMDAA